MSMMEVNHGIHQLPKDCYPPTESESDEGDESFVVLNDPDSSYVGIVEAFQGNNQEVLSTAPIERSLTTMHDMTKDMEQSAFNTMHSFATVSVTDSIMSVNGVELNLTQIQSRVESVSMENAQLKEAVKQNTIAMKDQCEKITKLRDEHQETINLGKEKLKESAKTIEQLTTENNVLKSKWNEHSNMNQQESNKLCKTLNELVMSIEQLKTENNVLKSKWDEQSNMIQQLRQDNAALVKINTDFQTSKEALDKISTANMNSFELENAERKIKDMSTSLERSTKNEAVLQNKLSTLETLSESSKLRFQEEIARLKEKVSCFEANKEAFNQLQDSQKTMTDQMAELQIKIVEMTGKITELSTDNVILREQLSVYKDDFEEERAARQKLKQDEHQLQTDLAFTRKLNDDLKAENAKLKVSIPSAMPPSKEPAADSSPVSTRYECPICSVSFRTFRLLEDHVESCTG